MTTPEGGSTSIGAGTTAAPSPEVADIISQLRGMIAGELDVRIKAEEITDDVPLLEGGLALDSIVLYEFISLIEKRFRFEFADQALSTEIFASLTVLARHIHAATSQPKQAVAV